MNRYSFIPRPAASFELAQVTDDIVFIRDLDRGLTVTNDAENVVRDLHKAYPDRRIVYCDTSGDWAELVHVAGRFQGFKHYAGEHP